MQRDTDLSRFKLLFAPSPAQVDQAIDQGLTAGHFHFNESTGAGEQLEQFFSPGRQVIVLGKYWSSGVHYYWPVSSGPEALSAPPDFWWDTVLQLAIDNQQTSVPKHRTVSTGRDNWHRLDDIRYAIAHRMSSASCTATAELCAATGARHTARRWTCKRVSLPPAPTGLFQKLSR
ncbi:hypothetical protein [Parasynechococcus sp.]|uniref:hypothetical protein n=1 Tax=Parasynechococcus sp. TaxID=3101203 RepID=UPI0037049B1D